MFNHFGASGLKTISAEALERATKSANSQNKQCEKVILPQDLNLQPVDYRSAF